MITVTCSELRNKARKYFDAVEKGESIEVCRHGKAVALVSPVSQHSMERWKRANPAKLDGASLAKAILNDRRRGR